MNILLKKYALFLVVIVLVLFLGIKFTVPQFGNFFNSQSKIKAKKEKINDLKKNIESAKIAKQRAEAKKDEPKITKLIYESEYKAADINVNFNGMLETILEIAKQSGLKVKTIEFKSIPESDVIVQNHSSELAGTLLSSQLIGTYSQFQTFLRDIYRHQYLMGITNFKITPYPQDKKILVIDIDLSLYMKK